MNKETVEEAANNFAPLFGFSIENDVESTSRQEGFIAGAEWQKEQSSTEAIEFAEWIKENQFYTAKGMWMRKNALTGENEGRYNWAKLTTQQLYEIWKKSKQ